MMFKELAHDFSTFSYIFHINQDATDLEYMKENCF